MAETWKTFRRLMVQVHGPSLDENVYSISRYEGNSYRTLFQSHDLDEVVTFLEGLLRGDAQRQRAMLVAKREDLLDQVATIQTKL